MKPETKFQNKVLSDLKKLDKLWVLKTQEKTRKGVPDLLICANGKFVAIELKASPKSPLASLQRFEIEQIKSSGGLGFVANPENWGQIYARIKDISCQIEYNALPR